MKVRTVGDLVAALQQLDQSLPILAGTHYDNDVALTNEVDVAVNMVYQIEDEYHDWSPGGVPDEFQAVTIA